MKKYEEERYKFVDLKENIYPWVKGELIDHHALNGKHFSEKDAPVIGFIGDLKIVFAIKRGEQYEILKDNMIAPGTDIVELYHKACENLARDIEYVMGNTWYGAFGIIADGVHEPSALCLKHIWNVCVEKLQDDLVIMTPSKDTIIFAQASNKQVVDKLIEHGKQVYEVELEKISDQVFFFSKDRKELSLYEYN